jgi:hypothetical protein
LVVSWGAPKDGETSIALISNTRVRETTLGKLSGPDPGFAPKNALYAPGLEEEKVKTALPPAAIGKGLAGVGDKTDTASGEKNRTTGVWSLVEKETVSPLTTETEAALGTKVPLSLKIVTSVFAMLAKLSHRSAAVYLFLDFSDARAVANAGSARSAASSGFRWNSLA